MTAEIAIINKSAIVLAADSAITIGSAGRKGKPRVWKTSNKIFSLSPENDIAIMIYGNGSFCGVPWETIIKIFAQEKNVRFSSIEHCKTDFLRFVGDFNLYDDESSQVNTLALIVDLVERVANSGRDAKNKTEAKIQISKYLDDSIENINDVGFCDIDFIRDDFESIYSILIEEVFKEKTNFTVSKLMLKKVINCCFQAVQKCIPSNCGYCGVW